MSPSGGTGVQGDPLPRDPRRSLVELRVLILSAIILMLAHVFELGLTPLTSFSIARFIAGSAIALDIANLIAPPIIRLFIESPAVSYVITSTHDAVGAHALVIVLATVDLGSAIPCQASYHELIV